MPIFDADKLVCDINNMGENLFHATPLNAVTKANTFGRINIFVGVKIVFPRVLFTRAYS